MVSSYLHLSLSPVHCSTPLLLGLMEDLLEPGDEVAQFAHSGRTLCGEYAAGADLIFHTSIRTSVRITSGFMSGLAIEPLVQGKSIRIDAGKHVFSTLYSVECDAWCRSFAI